jgi:hypothetical protein
MAKMARKLSKPKAIINNGGNLNNENLKIMKRINISIIEKRENRDESGSVERKRSVERRRNMKIEGIAASKKMAKTAAYQAMAAAKA